MNDYFHKKHEAERVVKYFKERIKTIQDSIATLEATLAENKERAEAAVQDAEKVCPRVKTDRSRQTIKSEIDKLKKRIEQEQPERAEQEKIEAEYVEVMERYKMTKYAIKNEERALRVRSIYL